MNWYIYWYYANAYFFNSLIGWMAKGRGMSIYLIISFSPLYAFYAIPFMVSKMYFNMMTMSNGFIYWMLMFGVPILHLSIFYPGSRRYVRWETEYWRTCKDWKNILAILFSLCCIIVAGVLGI